MKSKRVKILFPLLGILLLLLLTVGGYYIYFGVGHRALPGTKIGNVSVVGKTEKEIIAEFNTTLSKKQISFTGNSINAQKATLAAIGVTVHIEKTAKDALALENSLANFFTIPIQGKTLTPGYTIDVEKANTYAKKLTAKQKNIRAAENPKVVAAGDHFKITDGKNGYGLNIQNFKPAIEKIIKFRKDTEITLNLSEYSPELTKADLKPTLETAEKMIAPKVAVKVGNKTELASATTKVSWVDLTGKEPKINSEIIKKWVNEISNPLIVKAVTGKRYYTKEGKLLLTQPQAVAEVTVTNADTVANIITKNMRDGRDADVAIKTAVGDKHWVDKTIAKGAEKLAFPAAEGEKWIDVNLSKYTLTAYVGATPVKGPISVVTGKRSTPTITGIYSIYHKTRLQDMSGDNGDGTRYLVKDVPDVMYFKGDYGIHGAYWNKTWGRGGSHGCVNVPLAEAKWLYGWAPYRTTVATHY